MWYSQTNCSHTWTACDFGSDSTTATTTTYRRFNDVLYIGPVDRVRCFDPLPLPKWWRWFDVFRKRLPVALHIAWWGGVEYRHREQERYPLLERRRRKRRAFLAMLRAP